MGRISKIGSSGLIRSAALGFAVACPLVVSAAFSKSSKSLNGSFPKSSKNNGEKIVSTILQRSFGEKINKTLDLIALDNDPKNGSEQSESELFLISEVVIQGIEEHPEKKRLQYAAYDAMSIRPGSKVTREQVKKNLEAVYATGWFSGVDIDPVETPLGIKLVVKVDPNPIFRKINISPADSKIELTKLNNIFENDYGKTINLNILQLRINEIKKWYQVQGYSLARISGPNRISPEGIIDLSIQEGKVERIDIVFVNDDGETENEKGKKVKGKTRKWVIQRELTTKPGDIFNRNKLERDMKRLYSTSLFNDLKVTLKPVKERPGNVLIVLGITEQRTGTLTGGIGYSGAQGVFGQAGLQESNFLGRSWKAKFNMSYGEYGALVNLSLTDPWIKGDKYRTSFKTSLFISREVPVYLRSSGAGHIKGVSDRYEPTSSYSTSYDITSTTPTGEAYSSLTDAVAADNTVSWFDYEGDSIVLNRTGYGFSFRRPMNGGDPFRRSKWSALLGMNFQKVSPIDYAGHKRPYGVLASDVANNSAPKDSIICVSYNCAEENTLVSFKVGTNYNNLNNSRNPTSGNLLVINSEQYISLGDNSPAFNRAKLGYSYFIPVNLLRLHKGCRPKEGEKFDCAQTIGFQVKTGTIAGDLPPYEAFCVGGGSSIRGWSNCDLAVGRSFGEATVEYRYPIWRIISGSLFVDAGTDFGSQSAVPGSPGKLLKKQGSGFSLGSGFVINTPVGPLRLEAASKDLGDDWRYNLGVGWKF